MSIGVPSREVFREGYVLWRRGHPTRSAYVLRSGSVYIGRGENMIRVKARTIIGEAALLGYSEHHDDCVLAEPSEIVVIPTDRFNDDFERAPKSVQSVCKALIWKLKLASALIGREERKKDGDEAADPEA